MAGNSAQCERRLVEAQFADGVQLLDLLCLWDQVKDGVEAFTEVGAAKGAYDYDFAGVRCHLTEFDDLGERKHSDHRNMCWCPRETL